MQKRCDHKLHIQYIVLFYSYFIFILYIVLQSTKKKKNPIVCEILSNFI